MIGDDMEIMYVGLLWEVPAIMMLLLIGIRDYNRQSIAKGTDILIGSRPVSYTHLTLPTKRIV